MPDNERVIILHETVAQSYLRDLGTLVTLVSIPAIGVLIGSSALEWTGIVLAFIWLLCRVSARKHVFRGSTTEAIEWLQRHDATR